MDKLEWLRETYRVPAKVGGRVIYTGAGREEFGTITGSHGPHVMIRLDGAKCALPFHPTWKLEYLSVGVSHA